MYYAKQLLYKHPQLVFSTGLGNCAVEKFLPWDDSVIKKCNF